MKGVCKDMGVLFFLPPHKNRDDGRLWKKVLNEGQQHFD